MVQEPMQHIDVIGDEPHVLVSRYIVPTYIRMYLISYILMKFCVYMYISSLFLFFPNKGVVYFPQENVCNYY